MRAKKTGNEQWLQQEGQTLPARSVAFIVTMAVQARPSAPRTALGPVGIGFLPKPPLMLLYGLDSWQHTGHRPASSVVAILFARTTITKDDRPIFLRLYLAIGEGIFLDRS